MRSLYLWPARPLIRLLTVLLGAAALALGLPFFLPAFAGGSVTNCSNDADFSAKLSGGGLVTFSCGASPHTIVLSSTKTINQNTTVDGGNLITLGGGSSLRLFKVSPGAALTLSNITLRDGYAPISDGGDGGAISNTGTLVISHSQLISNVASWQGGAIASNRWVTITDSLLAHNSSPINGGAIANLIDFSIAGFATFTISRSVLEYNSSSHGGAIYNYGQAWVNHSTLYANHADIWGGAIDNEEYLYLNDSTVSGNTAAGDGAAAYNNLYFTIDGATLTGNQAGGGGGAICACGYFPNTTVINSLLSGNTSGDRGGAIKSYQGILKIAGSTLSSNSAAGNGGGIYGEDGVMNITATVIASNTASGFGGGIDNYRFNLGAPTDPYGVLTLTNSTLSGNSATFGGGLCNCGPYYSFYNATAVINGSTFSANHAGNGAGIFAYNHRDTLTNVTLSGNTAVTEGGGLMLDYYGSMVLSNVTLSANRAITGGGLVITGVLGLQLLTATNTIIANSPSGGNCAGFPITATYSISSDTTCALPGGTNHNSTNPQLDAFGNYGGPTFVAMIKSTSPALNTGTATGAPATDQRGVLRPQGSGYDIGAVERRPGDIDVPLTPRLYLPLLER